MQPDERHADEGAPEPAPDDAWRLLDEKVLVQTDLLTISENTYLLPDGTRKEGQYVLRERGGAIVAAVTPDRRVLLVRQYRAAVGAFAWELPAGFLEAGEGDALERARAELRQETGYEAEEWYALGTTHPTPSRMDKEDALFLAVGARKTGGQDLDPDEHVQYQALPLEEVERMAADGRLTSATSLVALYRALRHPRLAR